MARSALPQDFHTQENVLMSALAPVSKWDQQVHIALDSVNVRVPGTVGLKITSINATSYNTTRTLAVPAANPMMHSEALEFWIYVHDVANLSIISVYIATTTDFANHWYQSKTSYFSAGWNRIRFERSGFAAYGTPSWSDPIVKVRLRVVAKTGLDASVTFDPYIAGVESEPLVCITYDDTSPEPITLDKPIYDAAGIKATMFVNTAMVNEIARVTTAQLQAAYADGWAIGNHTHNHYDLTTKTYAEVVSEWQTAAAWLIANGMPRCAYFGAYPDSAFDASVKAASAEAGMLAVRRGLGAAPFTVLKFPFQQGDYGIICATTTHEFAAMKTAIDTAIANRSICIIQWHGSVGEDLQAIVDYIVSKRIRCVTFDELYYGRTNPRYQSLPVGRT